MKSRLKPRARRLSIEALEKRQLLTSGVTAALNSAGVLSILGSDGNDQVRVRQTSGLITVAGISASWLASRVTAIDFTTAGGSDYISLASMANGGNQVLNKRAVISSGLAAAHVCLPGGQNVYLNSSGETLVYSPGNIPTVNGIAVTKTTASRNSAGVLSVTGTILDDNIQLKQSAGKISIARVNGSWSASSVTAIIVNPKGGTDLISLDSIANGGTQALQKNVTVNSGSGTDTVNLTNGHSVTMSGTGHVLTVAADGTATLDGTVLTWTDPPPPPPPPPPATWFDSNIQDAGIRAIGDQEFADGLMDRTDMINLLRAVEQTGTVTSTQMSDLTKIVNTAALFGTLDYVDQLASNIVLGNVANAHYQGAALGNLAVGSSAAQLELLVDKWFLGTDHPAAGSGYSTASGPLFLNGAAYTDIAQGGLGDCGLVSTFAEVALRRPDIVTNMFIVNGDSTDTVRFYQGTAARYVTVDSQLPGGYASIANELWVGLAEKAYAQINEEGWLDSIANGQNAYSAIVGTYIHDAQAQITGLSTVNFGSVSTSFSTFATLVAAGKMIGFASVSSPPVGGVIGNHAYAVISCDSTAQTVTLYNPGGSLVTLTWPQIQADFMYFERTV